MHIAIVCKVIDNFGDAGFSLRLAKALVNQSHTVILYHDHSSVFQALYPANHLDRLYLQDARNKHEELQKFEKLDMIIEPFGTSSEQTLHRFDLELKRIYPQTPWIVIDYLSSENWVEDFHLSQSIQPSNASQSTFFYPGFTEKTGGLIHCDYPAHLRKKPLRVIKDQLNIFVFSYPNAPIAELIDYCENSNLSTQVHIAGCKPEGVVSDQVVELPFLAQSDFDDLLAQYDVLFVRGEDSFVRAQLSGRPMIWQIYPTNDAAHTKKLIQFFEQYSCGLTADCKSALLNCWVAWNGLNTNSSFATSWQQLNAHWPQLQEHAVQWQSRLFNGPELVTELLLWRSQQHPPCGTSSSL